MIYLVIVTCPTQRDAERIAGLLLEKRLAACINILAGVSSFYWWKGRVESASEVLLLIKTKQDLLEELELEVKKAHPYELPEIIAFRVERGSKEYLDWVRGETK
jgi:periplasmic divalent cation tolerance protein